MKACSTPKYVLKFKDKMVIYYLHHSCSVLDVCVETDTSVFIRSATRTVTWYVILRYWNEFSFMTKSQSELPCGALLINWCAVDYRVHFFCKLQYLVVSKYCGCSVITVSISISSILCTITGLDYKGTSVSICNKIHIESHSLLCHITYFHSCKWTWKKCSKPFQC